MGSMSAIGMASAVNVGVVDIRSALSWHLTSNHYPPLPLDLVDTALRVIDKANAGEWNRRVKLPEGITFRGSQLAPVGACVDAWHLHEFLDADGGDFE